MLRMHFAALIALGTFWGCSSTGADPLDDVEGEARKKHGPPGADASIPSPEAGVDAGAPDSGKDSSAPSLDAGTPPPSCGNGLADLGEACDGSDLNGNSCASLA